MNFKDLVKEKASHLSFENISEPRTKETMLRIIVNASENVTDLLIYPHPDSNVKTFQIDFPNYITYSVIYDDFTVWNDAEQFEGDSFRVYSKSNYLDFVHKESQLEDILPGKKFTHYSLACYEHNVNVISYLEPVVTDITMKDEG
ncbi:hypothetical protein [Virgibacillus doumboii]|uniref:hypothetical protein n=1 Tax=Virgibacillus doumboii TaxID=2697503 RepID=UPI0013DF3FC0|nr:hypothetical protein [Virgibacillus doumboii]